MQQDVARVLVGSDCSGYGSDMLALQLLGLKPNIVFGAEKDDGKRALMHAAHPVGERTIIYNDITLRNNETAPYVDLFISGAPCPAFSNAGRRMGLKDLQDRGVVIFYSLDYVWAKRPRVAVFENVKGLTQGSMKDTFNDILNVLMDLGYTVTWEVLDTKDHGIPHSRPRAYIVAVRSKHLVKPIAMPKPFKMPEVTGFLDMEEPSFDERSLSTVLKKNLQLAKTKHGKSYKEKYIFVDVMAGSNFAYSIANVCPCITKARGRPGTRRFKGHSQQGKTACGALTMQGSLSA